MGDSNDCKNVEQVLEEVAKELLDFQARKLDELKKELETFVGVKQTAIADYRNKYGEFITRWRDEGAQIERLHKELVCSYKDWKDLIQSAICPLLEDIDTIKADIESKNACKGAKELARDNARWQLDLATTQVEAWKTATKKIDELFKANKDLISQIQNLSQGQDAAFRIYLFWGKLIPNHNQLTPTSETPLYSEEMFINLCKKSSHYGQQDPLGETNDTSTRQAPWIIDKDKYEDILDSTFCKYKKQKDAYAKAVSEFGISPDDLASLIALLNNKNKSLDDNAKQKLKDVVGKTNE